MLQNRHRAMLIGAIGAGKSTLTNALLGRKVAAVKTQSLTYYDWIVDTPGEYVENPMFYKSIMATALEVTHVLFIQDATNPKTIFPPGFAGGIPKIPIGIVTKVDDAKADAQRAIRQLKLAMPQGPIVLSSALGGQGIEEIRELAACRSHEEMKMWILDSLSHNVFFN
ncbi:EutP/PduV family microcompartment system protein [Aneurinibacillus tyrosinisolvens]|uniref:EutP/PduV family microcompartment system protein n=1 Tax=Aneurinibacillus tyrosinisolvens TaxID=1443435 RepID=UPI00063FC3C4|nr:EutP/PduV family microcompartment system protein [Aneurinibacillus tyrosinisolvens]